MTDEKRYWVAFSVFPGIGPVRFGHLLDTFGTAKAAWFSPLSDKFIHFRKTFDLDEYLEKLDTLHVSVLTLGDPKYPKLLKEISDPPFLLYIRGKNTGEPINLHKTIAVVGTRKITPYGQEVTRKLVTGLVAHGFTIVSGMALGVDTVAHQTALDCGGTTIAVLGSGIDIIYPPSNARLYRAISQGRGSAICSEFAPGVGPAREQFPRRNRIISGLSLGVVVIEGDERSGTLITARYAAEQGRDVFAVPGPVTSPMSRAPAILIKQGAKLVETVEDILDEINYR